MPATPSLPLPSWFQGHLPLAEIALSLTLGLLGWPLYASAVRLAGALAGLALGLGAVLVADEVHALGDFLIPALVISAVVGALLGVWLIRRVMPVAWLLMGASLGVMGLWWGRAQLGEWGVGEWAPAAQTALWAGAPLVVALLTVWLRRWIVILGTSALGAALLAPHLTPLGPPALAWWSAGTVGFAAVQVGLHRLFGLEVEPVDEEMVDEEERD